MENFWKVIKTRRSVREFRDKAIPLRYVKQIVRAASFAPSGSNKQNWHFILVKNKNIKNMMKDAINTRIKEFAKRMAAEERQRLFEHAEYYTFFADAPLVVAVVMKPYISYTGELLKKYRPKMQYAPTAGVQSVAAAVENMLLAARALGLGGCWMTGPLLAKDSLEEILNIRPPDELLAIVPIGFPKQFPSCPNRPPINRIMTVV